MGRAYSSDLRSRFLATVDEGISASEASRIFMVSRSTGIRWVDIRNKTSRVEALSKGGDRRSGRLEAYADLILGWIKDTPDLTLSELVSKLEAQEVKAGQSSVWRLLKRHGLTFKKRQLTPRSRSVKMLPKPERIGGKSNLNLMPNT